MKKIKQTLLALALVASLGLGITTTSYAATCSGAEACIKQGTSQVNSGSTTDLTSLIQNVINLLLFIVGAVSVIMIIVGGLRYTLSGGEQAQITSAKNTVLYSVVGLVVAFMSFAIVNFVVDRL